jgi:hypothetical protein
MELTRLGDTNFSHVKIDSDLKNDEVNDALLQDLQTAGKKADVVLKITSAKSDHSVNTKDGNKSRHGFQTAVDIATLDGKSDYKASNSTNGNKEFREAGNKVKDVLVSMGYNWNSEKGHNKAVLWQTTTGGNHYNHLHVSNKTGQTSDVDQDFKFDSDDSKSDETKSDKTKLDDKTGILDKMSPEQREKFNIKLLSMLGMSESKNKEEVLKETIRIKELMK